jgi:cullin-4
MQDARTFLTRMQEAWSTHTSQMLMVRNVFIYLDRTYVRDSQGVKSLWDVGLHLFRQALMDTGDVLPKIVAGIVMQCCTERSGEPVDRPMLSSLSRMLMALRLYIAHLEPALLTSTAEFYQSEGLAKVSALDVPQYLIHTEDRLRQEVRVA